MSVQLKETDSVVKIAWVPRYDGVERFLHWLYVPLFFVMVFTGLVLLLPAFQPLAQGDAGHFIRLVHRIFAIPLIAVPILYVILRPRRMLQTLGDILGVGKSDVGWFKAAIPYYLAGRHGVMPPQGRFNTGEKMNAVVSVGALIVLAITGVIMWVGKGSVSPGVFQAAVIIHDLAMAATVTMFIVHLYLAMAHPLMWQSLTGIRFGSVSESYAREHHSAWYFGKEKAWKMFEEAKKKAISAPAAAQNE
jgi:formate dehydrogenase subunit gamma